MTTWKQFIDEFLTEAKKQGQQALDEIEAFRQSFGKKREESRQEQRCLIEAFFEHQRTLPPSMRSAGALIYCPCRRCNPARW